MKSGGNHQRKEIYGLSNVSFYLIEQMVLGELNDTGY